MNKKGVLGHGLSLLAVVEDHAKGTLHYHLLFFGGLTPFVLQQFSSLGEVCSTVSVVLDTMYTGSIPTKHHVQMILQNVISKPFWNTGLKRSDIPRVNKEPLLSRHSWQADLDSFPSTQQSAESIECPFCIWNAVHCQVLRQNWHQHVATCHKGLLGATGCRLCMPSGLREDTSPILLSLKESGSDTDPDDQVDGLQYDVHEPMPKDRNYCVLPDGNVLYRSVSTDVLVWEVAKPRNVLQVPEVV